MLESFSPSFSFFLLDFGVENGLRNLCLELGYGGDARAGSLAVAQGPRDSPSLFFLYPDAALIQVFVLFFDDAYISGLAADAMRRFHYQFKINSEEASLCYDSSW